MEWSISINIGLPNTLDMLLARGVVMDTRLWIRANEREPPYFLLRLPPASVVLTFSSLSFDILSLVPLERIVSSDLFSKLVFETSELVLGS